MRTIAVLIGMDYAYMRGALKGIAAFFADKPEWQLDAAAANLESVERLAEIEPAGVISLLLQPQWLQRPELCDRPVCTLLETQPVGQTPNVTCDDVAFGRMAAEHLIECGFEHLAFVGPPFQSSRQRCRGVRDALGETKETLSVFEGMEGSHPRSHWRGPKWPAEMSAWLADQPRPLGVVAATDVYAVGVCQLCHNQDIRVPEDVAVVGIGNDDVLCQLSQPLISSVSISWEAIGYEAARRLMHRIEGESNDMPLQSVIPPIGVVPRGSTDITATTDETILKAQRYIRNHFGNVSLKVGQVAKHIGVTQQSLERRFRRTIGRSILQEIRGVRVNRTKQILAETDLPTSVIARHVGIRSINYLATTFRQVTGQTPSEFRKKYRPTLTHLTHGA